MDDLGKFAAEMRVLADAHCILECAKLKVADEKLAAGPELRQAMTEHFQRMALRHAAEEDLS
jgi:hypothetical protein